MSDYVEYWDDDIDLIFGIFHNHHGPVFVWSNNNQLDSKMRDNIVTHVMTSAAQLQPDAANFRKIPGSLLLLQYQRVAVFYFFEYASINQKETRGGRIRAIVMVLVKLPGNAFILADTKETNTKSDKTQSIPEIFKLSSIFYGKLEWLADQVTPALQKCYTGGIREIDPTPLEKKMADINLEEIKQISIREILEETILKTQGSIKLILIASEEGLLVESEFVSNKKSLTPLMENIAAMVHPIAVAATKVGERLKNHEQLQSLTIETENDSIVVLSPLANNRSGSSVGTLLMWGSARLGVMREELRALKAKLVFKTDFRVE